MATSRTATTTWRTSCSSTRPTSERFRYDGFPTRAGRAWVHCPGVTAIWGSEPGGRWQPLPPAAYPAEAALHDLVEQAPQMLPLAESPRLTVLGRAARNRICGPGSGRVHRQAGGHRSEAGREFRGAAGGG